MAQDNAKVEVKSQHGTKKKVRRKKTVTRSSPSTATPSVVRKDGRSEQPEEPTSPPPQLTPVKTTPHQSNLLLWVVLAMVLIVGGGVAASTWYLIKSNSNFHAARQDSRIGEMDQRIDRFRQSQTDLSVQVSQMKAQVAQVAQAEETFADQLSVLGKQLADQQVQLADKIATVDNQRKDDEAVLRQEFDVLLEGVTAVRSELGKSAAIWSLEEAEQLIFIAHQRLQLTGDAAIALKALKLADEQLAVQGGSAASEVRQQLAGQIAQLEQISRIDVVSAVTAIGALSDSIDQLPLPGDIGTLGLAETTPVPSSAEAVDESQASQAGGQGWVESISRLGRQFLLQIADLIQIEKHDEPVRPILSAEIKVLTVEKAKLILDSAEIAYIRQNYPLFEQRMQEAADWVSQRFDRQSGETDQWLTRLEALSTAPIPPPLPDLSKSLASIRALINQGYSIP